MSHHDTRVLLDLGRKAGLQTSELYRALTTRQPSQGAATAGQADTNGYVEKIDPWGRLLYVRQEPRS